MTERSATLPAPVSAQAYGVMILLAVIWGLSIPVTKLGLETVPPLTLTAMRFGSAVPLLLLMAMRGPRLPWKVLAHTAVLGVIGIGIGQLAQNFGVERTSASAATIISATIPLFTVVFAALRFRQPVSSLQKAGLLAAFAGIALVALGQGGGAASLLESSLAGAAILILSALAIAFYYVWSADLTRGYGSVAIVTWSTVFGFLSLVPGAAWEVAHTPMQIGMTAVLVALYLGLLVTVAGLFIWMHALRTVPARIAAAIQYLQPIVGVAASAWMFGDRLDLSFAAGVALVLLGLAMAIPSAGRK